VEATTNSSSVTLPTLPTCAVSFKLTKNVFQNLTQPASLYGRDDSAVIMLDYEYYMRVSEHATFRRDYALCQSKLYHKRRT
jgi:hypothetical protein